MKKPVGRQPGFKLSDESKALISKSRKGSVPVNRQCVSIDGVKYESIRAASKALNVKLSTVTYRCLSISAQFDGWVLL